jgi:DNA-binding response OmpR family regulator
MEQAGERKNRGLAGTWIGRAAIVFVSASAEDARAFRECAGAGRWLVVNVPDLAGAWAVIDKVRPELVVCDTEIEGEGSWRDLLELREAGSGFPLFVAARRGDETLRAEALNLGAIGVIERPFDMEAIEQAAGIGLRGRT